MQHGQRDTSYIYIPPRSKSLIEDTAKIFQLIFAVNECKTIVRTINMKFIPQCLH